MQKYTYHSKHRRLEKQNLYIQTFVFFFLWLKHSNNSAISKTQLFPCIIFKDSGQIPSHSEKQALNLPFLILIKLCLSYLPFVTVWAGKPWGGQANICLHVLAGIGDPTSGSGGCWVQWFKRAVSSVCMFPSVPLASAVGPCRMQTRRLPQKWHCTYLK